MREAIADRHLQDSTTIILSAKHGQSPQAPAQLTRIDDGAILTALDTAWQTAEPAWPRRHWWHSLWTTTGC